MIYWEIRGSCLWKKGRVCSSNRFFRNAVLQPLRRAFPSLWGSSCSSFDGFCTCHHWDLNEKAVLQAWSYPLNCSFRIHDHKFANHSSSLLLTLFPLSELLWNALVAYLSLDSLYSETHHLVAVFLLVSWGWSSWLSAISSHRTVHRCFWHRKRGLCDN